MSRWSRPYVTVRDEAGVRVSWTLPDPLPWPAGVSADPALRTPVDWGLPEGGTVQVRWRTPAHQAPRSRTRPVHDQSILALACDVLRAARADGVGWRPDDRGLPVPGPGDEPCSAAPARPTAASLPADPGPVVGGQMAVSKHNTLLTDIRDGRTNLGATVAQVIAAIRRQREPGWGATSRTNMANVLGFLEQVLVYTAPEEDELPEVAEWMTARLALPGVELGASMHVALLLAPDLERAIETRRYTDRRVDLLNQQAVTRYLNAWERYEALSADRALHPRGGRAPRRPPHQPELREPELPVKARTEELFAMALSMVLGYAEQHGLLAGPNPWRAFTARGQTRTGYRRSSYVRPHERNVPPVGAVVDLADHIATLGPIDPRTGKPTGDRFRALVLTGLLGLRPSELDALAPTDFVPGPWPHLLVNKSASMVHTQASLDGSSFEVRDGLKHRTPGASRTVEIPHVVADALSAHIAAGYATGGRLFTSPQGSPVRWGNLTETYWQPAVAKVLGGSSSTMLTTMPRSWLRKTAITWLLRSGLSVEEIAQRTGHDVMVLYTHYAGFVEGHKNRHTWTNIDDAWAWAAAEHDVP